MSALLRSNFPRPGTERDAEAIKANAFHDQRIVVVSIDDQRLSWVDRQELERIGAKIYGRRKAQPGGG